MNTYSQHSSVDFEKFTNEAKRKGKVEEIHLLTIAHSKEDAAFKVWVS